MARDQGAVSRNGPGPGEGGFGFNPAALVSGIDPHGADSSWNDQFQGGRQRDQGCYRTGDHRLVSTRLVTEVEHRGLRAGQRRRLGEPGGHLLVPAKKQLDSFLESGITKPSGRLGEGGWLDVKADNASRRADALSQEQRVVPIADRGINGRIARCQGTVDQISSLGQDRCKHGDKEFPGSIWAHEDSCSLAPTSAFIFCKPVLATVIADLLSNTAG